MVSALAVGFGGFIGSVARYFIFQIPYKGNFPVVTLLINLVSAFLMGFFSELAKDHSKISPNTALFLQIGFCGGFSTLAAFSLETVRLFERGKFITGTLYTISTFTLSLLATFSGIAVAKVLKSRAVAS